MTWGAIVFICRFISHLAIRYFLCFFFFFFIARYKLKAWSAFHGPVFLDDVTAITLTLVALQDLESYRRSYSRLPVDAIKGRSSLVSYFEALSILPNVVRPSFPRSSHRPQLPVYRCYNGSLRRSSITAAFSGRIGSVQLRIGRLGRSEERPTSGIGWIKAEEE